MANKTLTARVRLNTTQAERSLDKLIKKIDQINATVNKTARSSQVTKQLTQNSTQLDGVNNKVKTWANLQKQVNSQTKSTNNLLGTIGTKLKGLAATYLGIMGAKMAIKTSDTITSAENRLNNLEGGNPNLTAESMDKMYAAAQRARSGYDEMLSNVSKTMTLAGDSFQGNIDNAIRFQEIMSKAYTVGGASAAEQASSMYQLVQALGSGILQGDELRSVREGAPIAYKEIEKFAQGVLDTEESLKELASKGLITSDIIVGAIMGAEEKITKSFENTQMTFAQAWDSIKNMAIRAFQPVLQMLNDALNSDAGQALIDGIGDALVVLANIIMWVADLAGKFFTWFIDNWEWLKYVLLGALIIIGWMFLKTAATAIISALQTAWAWLQAYWPLLLIVAGIMAILYIYELWRQGTITTTEAIAYCLLVIGAIFLVVAAIMTAGIWLIIGLVVIAVALAILYFAEFCGYINVGVQAIVNSWYWCCNLVAGAWEWACAAVGNGVKWLGNVFWAFCNSVSAIAQNIGIALENAWIGAQNMFWSFIQACLEGLRWLEPAINAIAELFGAKGFTLSGVIEDVANKQQDYKSFVSVGDAWDSGMNTYAYKDLGAAWNKGWNTHDVFQDGWASDAYNAGYGFGSAVEDAVNQWFNQYQTHDKGDAGLFTDLGKKLGLTGNGLPDPNSDAYKVGGAYDPSAMNDDIANALDKLGKISDDTGDIKDSMDLSNDDLEYLRKIADMEWRNEFTTAEIKVDMTNNNTVNGERDLDGIVTYLSDVLRAEMSNVAHGVHY